MLSIDNLQYGYTKSQPILKGLSMHVPKGSIYGFLGVNGAGKSTTIRNVLGLLKPQKGEIRLFGEALSTQKPQVFSKIGALIESPSLYPQLNAQDNLRLACKYHGISNKGIDGILEKVGLLAHQKKRSKNYSTGMKQRLGLAMALIHNPDLLILDEPTKGLASA